MTNEQQANPNVVVSHFNPIVTEVGMQRLFAAAQSEQAVTVTHIALGDSGWTPTAQATALQQERYRTTISGTRRLGDMQQHMSFIVQGESEYWVREVGLILADGTLFAIWSDEQHALAWKSAHMDLLLGYDLLLTALPSDNIIIQASNELNLAPGTQVYRGILRLATTEEANALTLDDVALSPATLPIASESQQGINCLATQDEVNAGVEQTKSMTPATYHAHSDAHYAQKNGNYADLRAQATTKADVGLSNVPNYSATNAIDDDSDEKFATASAVKQVNDSMPPRQRLVWGSIQYGNTSGEDIPGIGSCTALNAPDGCVIVGVLSQTTNSYGTVTSNVVRIKYKTVSLE